MLQSDNVRPPPVTLTKAILALLALLVGAIALDRAAELVLTQLLLHSKYRYLRVYRAGPAALYLIVGNSRAGVHFMHSTDPAGSFFNLGSGGMGVPYSEALVADYVAHHGAPKVTIIEMTFISDARSGEDIAGLLRAFSERARGIRNDQSWFQTASMEVFHLLRFNHATLLNALVGLFYERSVRSVDIVISDSVLQHVEQMPPFRHEVLPVNAQALARMIGELRQRGSIVVCVLSPMLKQFRDKIVNVDEFLGNLRRIAESNGAVFWDDSTFLSDRVSFSDQVHLNTKGARAYNEMFLSGLAGAVAVTASSGDLKSQASLRIKRAMPRWPNWD